MGKGRLLIGVGAAVLLLASPAHASGVADGPFGGIVKDDAKATVSFDVGHNDGIDPCPYDTNPCLENFAVQMAKWHCSDGRHYRRDTGVEDLTAININGDPALFLFKRSYSSKRAHTSGSEPVLFKAAFSGSFVNGGNKAKGTFKFTEFQDAMGNPLADGPVKCTTGDMAFVAVRPI